MGKQTVFDHHTAFDIIGDVHGCFEELVELLLKLGYEIDETKKSKYGYKVKNPRGRRVVFVGDICDRGPQIVKSFRLVMTMVEENQALMILGNHEAKLIKKLNGRHVQVTHGLENTMEELEKEPKAFVDEVHRFLEQLPIQLVLDQGRLIVAHAGLPEKYHGKSAPSITRFALYGDVSGKRDEHGLPIRRDWSLNYRGDAIVVYGHVPREEPYISNNTYGIDTGCVFGGYLTALRYPEMELVKVKAKKVYSPHIYLKFD